MDEPQNSKSPNVVRSLELHTNGLAFPDPVTPGQKRKFAFHEVDHLYLSTQNMLSFQFGDEIFTVPFKQDNPRQMEVLHSLIQSIEKATPPM